MCDCLHFYPEPCASLVSIYISYYIVQFVFSEKYFCADKYIISYCKPQLTGSCKISYYKNFMSDAVSCNVSVLHDIVMWCLTPQAILQGQLFICVSSGAYACLKQFVDIKYLRFGCPMVKL